MERERLNESGGSYFAAPQPHRAWIPTGCKTLDLALGGGWAEGRVINVVGDKSTGKTLLMIEASANFTRKHRTARIRYREAEQAWDNDYARALGMPLDRVDFGAKPLETVEDLYEDYARVIAKARGPELYILDSLDSLSDREEMKRAIDKGAYGTGKAKIMSSFFRQLKSPHVTLMIVSQIRDRIGVTFGRQWSRSGGKALDFYTSQIVVLAQAGQIKREVGKTTHNTGIKVRARVEKNKVGLPQREAEFPVLFGYGVDDVAACLDYADKAGVLAEVLNGSKRPAFEASLKRERRPEVVARMHDVIERHWYATERTLLPPLSKYGD